MIVAIDGPAGAGKSTVSRLIAERLGSVRIDTGALYRAVALAATRHDIPLTATETLRPFVEHLAIELVGDRVLLDGEDVSQAIRTPEISLAASAYAAVPAVRAGLMELQRRLGRSAPSVMDGRDIGTVVFPDADVKLYLTASADARADRRYRELVANGVAATREDVLREIVLRDHQDMTRAVAPLRQAEDATVIDATELSIEGTVGACLAAIRRVADARK